MVVRIKSEFSRVMAEKGESERFEHFVKRKFANEVSEKLIENVNQSDYDIFYGEAIVEYKLEYLILKCETFEKLWRETKDACFKYLMESGVDLREASRISHELAQLKNKLVKEI